MGEDGNMSHLRETRRIKKSSSLKYELQQLMYGTDKTRKTWQVVKTLIPHILVLRATTADSRQSLKPIVSIFDSVNDPLCMHSGFRHQQTSDIYRQYNAVISQAVEMNVEWWAGLLQYSFENAYLLSTLFFKIQIIHFLQYL